MGDAFTMADCAAAPALFYADKVLPFTDTHKNTAAYFGRLMERASYARAIKEAAAVFRTIPGITSHADHHSRFRRFRTRRCGPGVS